MFYSKQGALNQGIMKYLILKCNNIKGNRRGKCFDKLIGRIPNIIIFWH
jgi:hypothetical protein